MTPRLRKVRAEEPFLSNYTRLLAESPHTTPFHTLEWLDVLRGWVPNSSLFFLVIEAGAELLGAMPVIEKKLGPLRFFYSLPFGTYGGFVTREKLKPIEGWEEFLLPRGGMSQVVDLWGTLKSRDIFMEKKEICHLLRLPSSYEQVRLEIYERTQRKNLRAAVRRGLVSQPMNTEEEVRIFYPLYAQLYSRKGTKPLSYNNLRRGMEILLRSGMWRGFLAKLRGRVLGGIVSLFNPNMTVAYLVGYSDEGRSYKIMNFLIDTAIRDAVELKSKSFNLGTTPGAAEGIIRFKESFGARPHTYPEYRRTSRIFTLLSDLRKR